jgi:hypothetical protein
MPRTLKDKAEGAIIIRRKKKKKGHEKAAAQAPGAS